MAGGWCCVFFNCTKILALGWELGVGEWAFQMQNLFLKLINPPKWVQSFVIDLGRVNKALILRVIQQRIESQLWLSSSIASNWQLHTFCSLKAHWFQMACNAASSAWHLEGRPTSRKLARSSWRLLKKMDFVVFWKKWGWHFVNSLVLNTKN